jgi:rhodanese-related sulfurtransferase
MDRGAVLVDIREPDEHSRLRIAGARHQPLSRLKKFDVGKDTSAERLARAGRWSKIASRRSK